MYWANLANEELYDHARLNGDHESFRAMVRAAGTIGGYDEFNWRCVRQRRAPHGQSVRGGSP